MASNARRPLLLAILFPCLVLGGAHFLAESPKRLFYQNTPPDCKGEHDHGSGSHLASTVASAPPSDLQLQKLPPYRLATSALSSLNSVICGVATVAMDDEITSMTLFAISTNSSRLLPLVVNARIIPTFLRSH